VTGLLEEWNAATHAPPPVTVETSGSTGAPKRVLLSRAAIRASATATHERLGSPGSWLLALPATYVAVMQVIFRSLLAGREPVVLAEHPDLAAAVDAMPGPVRYASLVPTQLVRALDRAADVAALRRLSAVLVGGAALEPGTRAAAEEAGIRVVASYGMSETCGGCVYDGLPLDGVRVAVSGSGRVRIGGTVLFDGYDEQPELTAQALRDGWFLTSDIGRLGIEGRLEVLGRVDDVVVSGGVNVHASAVAARLAEHASVEEVTVVGVPDAEWGERVVAVVVPVVGSVAGSVVDSVLDSGDRPSLGELRDFVSGPLPREWAPRQVVYVGALPRLPQGKVDRLASRAVAARAGGGDRS
jgi:O-succinylbenzoic acid--CoA ligase